MWKLKDININGKVVLAPMAGFTSSAYRKYFTNFGISLAYTEMVSDMGLIYGNKETFSYLPQEILPIPVGIQLFGNDKGNILKAAFLAKNSAKQMDFIDINMACPVPKVTKTGAGSMLLKDPKKCGDIIRILKENFDVPITAKIRLGWDDKSINYLEVIHELEMAGVDMIAIHARTKKDLYTGLPRFELLKDLRSKMHVPLLVSGNIYTLDDAINAINITGADAVMIARGGIGNPYLAKQIDHYYKTGERLLDPSYKEQKQYCLELAKLFILEKGEEKGMMIYRSIAPRFFFNLPNVRALKSRLACELVSYDSLQTIIEDYERDNGII